MDDQAQGNYHYNSIGQLTENVSEGIAYIYTTSGLVSEVQRNGQPLVKFFYNDRNHRMRKETYFLGNLIYTTHYVRDVAGRTMAVYSDVGGNLALAEQPIYGAGRIGVAHANGNNAMTYVYELTDHLGNVRAVFTKNGNGADLEGYTDYYPFGMPMPGRNMIGDYRYGFQGQYAEKDEETGLNAFELRMYDSRIGRWTSPDPYGQFNSPYIGMGNNPISYADPDGGCVGSDCPDKVTYGQNDCQCSTFDMETGITTTHFSNTNEILSFISTPTADWSNPFTSFDLIDGDPNFNPSEIRENPKTWIDDWEQSGNIFAQASYSTANAFSIVGQSLNPFDNQVTTLTGSNRTGMDNSYYGGETAASLLPVGGAVGIKYTTQALVKAVSQPFTKKTIFRLFNGKFRLENGAEAIPKSIQKANGIKLTTPVQKPFHFSVLGMDIPLNPFNPLWRLF